MNTFFIVILLVVALLNIILFFKVWGMTNNIKSIMSFYIHEKGIRLIDDGATKKYFKDKDGKIIEMM